MTKIASLTDKPITHLVISHWHGDHMFGVFRIVEEFPDVQVIAHAGTVAVLLPGAFYVLRETRRPPVDALRRHRVPMAIATDSNPGSSPIQSMTLILNMACTLFELTPEEALAGATREGARALGLNRTTGTLETGKHANLVLWNAVDPAELSYNIGNNPCRAVMYRGQTN